MGMVGGSHIYDGPGLGHGPWKCPACAATNVGSIDDGCTSCGSGSAKPQHVGVDKPPRVATPPPLVHVDLTPVRSDLQMQLAILAGAWAREHEGASLADAFLAGYQLATQQTQAHTMAAPPVTADLGAFHPDGKVRRTIIAALELFKDQVLRDAQDEITSGEWCSIEEIDQVIRQLKDEESSHD